VRPLALRDLAKVVSGELVAPGGQGAFEDVEVSEVTVNSDRARAGAAFFALPGMRADGHSFVEDAARNGAAVAVVRRGQPVRAPEGLPLLVVDEPLVALQRLAGWWRRELACPVVAVVGSNGKTVTKDCLVHLLAGSGDAYGSPGSYNSQLGVPLALLACPASASVAVIEVAVSGPGEMARQAEMLRPDHVVLTNVGLRWRSRFRGRAAQVEEIVSVAGPVRGAPGWRQPGAVGWVLVGEGTDDLVAAVERRSRALVHNGSGELPRYLPAERSVGGARFEVEFPSGYAATVAVRAPSDEILADAQLAMSAAYLLGRPPSAIVAAMAGYTPTATRLEIWRSPDGVTLVRDVATPDPITVASGVRTARRLTGASARTVVVLAEPDAEWADHAADLAAALLGEGADEVCAVRAAAHLLVKAAFDGSGTDRQMKLFDDQAALRSHLVGALRPGDACLVQSVPGAAIDDLATVVVEAMSPTRLYMDLAAVEDNLSSFRRALGPSVRIMAMVKALAYGTDAVGLSLSLQELGVDFLGVSNADEGIALRRAGVSLPVLVLLGTVAEVPKMVGAGLTPVVYSPEVLDAVLAASAGGTFPVKVHLEVDTGFHRAGLQPGRAIEALARLQAAGVVVEGLMTHLSCADDPGEDAYTALQLDRFEEVAAAAEALGLRVTRHAAATAASIRVPRARYDMVRLGLGLYGVHPSAATAAGLELSPALGLVSRLVQVIEVPGGERVGYGGTWAAPPGGARIGVVPAGYHDCVPRALSNVGHVLVAGARCPIVGRVSMDSMTVDISGCPDAQVGSDVLVYGRRGELAISVEEVAGLVGTIAYEVMARVGPRVQRILTRH